MPSYAWLVDSDGACRRHWSRFHAAVLAAADQREVPSECPECDRHVTKSLRCDDDRVPFGDRIVRMRGHCGPTIRRPTRWSRPPSDRSRYSSSLAGPGPVSTPGSPRDRDETRDRRRWAERTPRHHCQTTSASPSSGHLRGVVPMSSRSSIERMGAKVRPFIGVSAPTVVPHTRTLLPGGPNSGPLVGSERRSALVRPAPTCATCSSSRLSISARHRAVV